MGKKTAVQAAVSQKEIHGVIAQSGPFKVGNAS